VRDGKEMTVAVPVSPERPKLVSGLDGRYPSYFIYGPLVFSPATENLVNAMTTNTRSGASLTTTFSQRGSPLLTRRGDKPAFPGEELVMIPSPFFPHKLVKGYGNPFGRVVETMNDVRVKNLLHLVELLRDSKQEFTVLTFGGQGGESLVLPHQGCLAATEEVLTDSGVRAQGSADALALWTARPGANP